MTLTWPQINDLAAALNAAHPFVDRLSLVPAQLLSLVGEVSGGAVSSLSEEEANAIKWQWMKLADTPPVAAQAGGRG